jgi:hypothetical protein
LPGIRRSTITEGEVCSSEVLASFICFPLTSVRSSMMFHETRIYFTENCAVGTDIDGQSAAGGGAFVSQRRQQCARMLALSAATDVLEGFTIHLPCQWPPILRPVQSAFETTQSVNARATHHHHNSARD